MANPYPSKNAGISIKPIDLLLPADDELPRAKSDRTLIVSTRAHHYQRPPNLLSHSRAFVQLNLDGDASYKG